MIGEKQSVLYRKPKEPLVAKLSLISLMDIFTILVFFLMLNSGETQNIETVKVVQLPDSIAGKSPHTDLMIFVSEEHVIFEKQPIAEISAIRENPDVAIDALSTVLAAHTENLGEIAEQQTEIGYAVTIMADKDVDYEILKSVMETCREHNYRNISLAVNRIAQPNLRAKNTVADGTPVSGGIGYE